MTSALTPAIVWHPGYSIAHPPEHPFPMGKFARLGAWMTEREWPVQRPHPCGQHWLEAVHEPGYLADLQHGRLAAKAQRRIGFDCTPALFERCRLEAGGTLLAVDLALAQGLACNAAGGTHHAHAGFGSGYCLLNDLAVATRYAQDAHGCQRILIFDLDVHQGDGTAALLNADPQVRTVSIHCAENFPARKRRSDLDWALPRGTGDRDYLAVVDQLLPWLLETLQPDLVLYDAGVDVHAHDRLGYLSLSDAGIFARDQRVLAACWARRIPVAAVIGGGYDRDLDRLARRHALLFEAAAAVINA